MVKVESFGDEREIGYKVGKISLGKICENFVDFGRQQCVKGLVWGEKLPSF